MTRHVLAARSDTVRVGVIDRAFAPVLPIDSGDEVELRAFRLGPHDCELTTPSPTRRGLLAPAVNRNNGVHVRFPRALLRQRARLHQRKRA